MCALGAGCATVLTSSTACKATRMTSCTCITKVPISALSARGSSSTTGSITYFAFSDAFILSTTKCYTCFITTPNDGVMSVICICRWNEVVFRISSHCAYTTSCSLAHFSTNTRSSYTSQVAPALVHEGLSNALPTDLSSCIIVSSVCTFTCGTTSCCALAVDGDKARSTVCTYLSIAN